MGRPGRNRNATAASGWHAGEHGVSEARSRGGGQAGRSWSVRFTRDDMPGSLITVTFCATGDRGEFDVLRKVEWIVCTDPSDPAGTRAWSAEDCEHMCPVAITTAEGAEREAYEMACETVSEAATYGTWDGEPWE